VFVFLAILCYSQNGDNPQEYWAKFGCKLNMKFIYLKKNPSTFFATCLNCVQKYGDFFSIFGVIMAIEKLKEFFACLVFSIASKKNAETCVCLCVYLMPHCLWQVCDFPHDSWILFACLCVVNL
jgi:hypothetical protein